MPHGNPSPKLAITVDAEVHRQVLAESVRDGVSVSAWMTRAAREALLRRAGLAAVDRWETQLGRLTDREMAEARQSVRAQMGAQRKRRRSS